MGHFLQKRLNQFLYKSWFDHWDQKLIHTETSGQGLPVPFEGSGGWFERIVTLFCTSHFLSTYIFLCIPSKMPTWINFMPKMIEPFLEQNRFHYFRKNGPTLSSFVKDFHIIWRVRMLLSLACAEFWSAQVFCKSLGHYHYFPLILIQFYSLSHKFFLNHLFLLLLLVSYSFFLLPFPSSFLCNDFFLWLSFDKFISQFFVARRWPHGGLLR